MAKTNKAQEFLAEVERDEQNRKELERDRREAQRHLGQKELEAKYKLAIKQLEIEQSRNELLLAIDEPREKQLFEKLSKSRGTDSTTAIVCLSDWHAGELVDPNDIDGANEFDKKICERRIKHTVQNTIERLERLREFSQVQDIVVWLGGDMITGFLHEDNKRSNTMAPNEEVIFCQDMIEAGLNTFLASKQIKTIRVVTNHGNHGRLNPKPILSRSHRDSLEWMMYTQIARSYRGNNRIAFQIGQGIHNHVEVEGRLIRFHHGDFVKFNGAIGGISTTVEKSITGWNSWKTPALDIFGHFHQFNQHWSWVSNGCLIGYNAYANSIKAKIQPPTQTLILMSRKYGKVMAIPIFCE